mgnify:CR=1 FL=1
MKKIDMFSIVWKEGKYFVAQCLNADVSSFGKIKAEAVKNLQETFELYLEDAPPAMPKIASPSLVRRVLQYA